MLKHARGVLIVAAVVLLALVTMPTRADLVNGDFSQPLSVGWVYQSASVVDEKAVLTEDPFVYAYMEQEFTIPDLSLSLSFDYKASFEAGGDEAFSASLLDPFTFDPLIPYDADPFDPFETYYFQVNNPDGFFPGTFIDPAFVTITDLGGDWFNVALDLGSLGGLATGALLAFDFIGFDFSLNSSIEMDNVHVTLIPAPGAVGLGMVGLTTLAALRRRL